MEKEICVFLKGRRKEMEGGARKRGFQGEAARRRDGRGLLLYGRENLGSSNHRAAIYNAYQVTLHFS